MNPRLTLFWVCFVFSSTFSALAAEGYFVPSGTSLFIAEKGLCANVTNSLADGLFVPTKTLNEWQLFLNSTYPNVTKAYQACSCKSLLAMGTTTSGIYSTDPDGPGPLTSMSVYCDMDTSGGGWTLIARSVSGAPAASFGWNSARGSVSDDSIAYSLNAAGNNVSFSQILFGSYSAGKTWGSYVYRKSSYPDDFYTSYTNSTVSPASNPTAIIGGITNFTLARHVGFTSLTTRFFFRDAVNTSGSFGLNADGWQTGSGGLGGNINGLQGMLMIR